MLGQQVVGVLVDAQLIQREEVLAAEVAAVTQLLLVALDVVEERLQLLEGLSAALHHTLVHLGEEGEQGQWHSMGTNRANPLPADGAAFLAWKSLQLGTLQNTTAAP